MTVEKSTAALVLRKLLETKALTPELEAALRLGHEPVVFEDGGAYVVSTGEKVLARIEVDHNAGEAEIVWLNPELVN